MRRQKSVSPTRAGFAIGAITGFLLGTAFGAIAGRINEFSLTPPDPAYPEDNFLEEEDTMMGMMIFWGPVCAIFGAMSGAIGGAVGGAVLARTGNTAQDHALAVLSGCLWALAVLAWFRGVIGFPGGDVFRPGVIVWMIGTGVAAIAGTTFGIRQLKCHHVH